MRNSLFVQILIIKLVMVLVFVLPILLIKGVI